MGQNVTNKVVINEFREKFQNSEIINFSLDNRENLELITPSYNTFFDMLFSGKKFEVVTFFDHTLFSEENDIEFNSVKIMRKNKYSKETLLKYLSVDQLEADKVTSTTLPLLQSKILSKYLNMEDVYLSYGNLYYQLTGEKTISLAPLVFFKINVTYIDDRYYIRLDYNSPLYNYPVIDLIKRFYNVDISYNEEGFDYDEFIQTIRQKTKKLLFAVDDAVYINRIDILNSVRLKHILDIWPKNSSNPVYRSLEEKIEPNKNTIMVNHSKHPEYINKGLQKLEDYPILKLSKNNPLSEKFIEAAIEEYILRKKNVVIVSSNKSIEAELNQKINANYYDVFTPYKDFTKPNIALFTYFEAVKNHPDVIIDSAALVTREEIRQNVLKHKELDNSLKNISISTGETSLEVFDSYYKYYKESTKLYDFDSESEYEYEDYLADKDFLNSLNDFGGIATDSFTKHPFYGLNSAIKIDEYDKIMGFLKVFVKDIEDFTKTIDESDIKESNWSDFNSIRDYDDAEKIFDIFSEYESFPLEYFNIDFSDKLLDELELLKEYYRLEASMKLSIEMVCKPMVWQKDFDEVLKAVSTSRGELETRREFKSIMKINANRHNFRALMVLFNKYEVNKLNESELLPELQGIFQDKVNNIDGLVSIEKAYEFIQSYKRHKKVYLKYDFENEFTKKIFHDKEFLEKYKKNYFPSLNLSRSVIEHDLDQYHKYFNEDKFDYVQASFSDNIERMNIKINSTVKEFEDYLNFSIKADDSSMQLRSALDEIEEENGNLVNFDNNYLASLYKFLLKKEFEEKKGLKLSEDNSANVFDLYRLIEKDPHAVKLDVVNVFSSVRKNLLDRPSYIQTITTLKEKYHYRKLFSAKDAINVCGNELFHLYPLYSTRIDKTDCLGKYQFDLAIIYLDDQVSLLDIYTALSLGKKCLVVNSKSTQFDLIEEIELDLKKDLEPYRYLVAAKQIFKDKFNKALDKQGIKLVKNKVINENVIIPYYYEKYGEKYALRFESSYKELSSVDLHDIPSLLYLSYGIKTTYLYPLNFMLYEDLSVMSLYKDIKEYISTEESITGNRITNLSYDQKKKYMYFETLKKIDASFAEYSEAQEIASEIRDAKLTRSSIKDRPIVNISYLEIANGILTYLERFTYLNRDILISHIANIVGTISQDVDFRLLFAKAENYLVSEHVINFEKNRLGLIRE